MKKSLLMAAVLVAGLARGVYAQSGDPKEFEPAPKQPVKAPPTKPAPTARGKVDLRPRFKVGQEVRFKVDSTQISKHTGNAPAGDDPVGDGKQEVSMTVMLRCKDGNSETGYTLDLVIEAIKLDMKVGGTDVHVDSSKPDADDPMGELVRGIVGTTIPAKMDNEGNFTAIGGGMGDLGGQLGGGGAGDMFKGMFGPLSTTKKGTGQVNVGDTWTNDDTMNAAMGTVKIRTTNLLKSASGGSATISTRGTFSLDPSATGKGVAIRDSNFSGETKWDTENGMLDTMNMVQKLTIEQRDPKGGVSSSTQERTIKANRLSGTARKP